MNASSATILKPASDWLHFLEWLTGLPVKPEEETKIIIIARPASDGKIEINLANKPAPASKVRWRKGAGLYDLAW